jgi:hypothetical protein
MALIFNAVFDCDAASVNDGKIVIRAGGEGVVGQSWAVRIAIKNPAGAIFRSKPVAADATVPDTATNQLVLVTDIPETAEGKYQGGVYTFLFYVTNVTSGVETLATAQYLFEAIVSVDHLWSSVIKVNNTVNCLNGDFIALDETDYTGWTLLNRLMTINHPVIPGIVTPLPTTSSTASVNVTATHVNVTYQSSLSSTVEKSVSAAEMQNTGHAAGFSQKHTGNIYLDTDIECDNRLCDTLSCLEQRFLTLDQKACAKGGWAQLTPPERANFEYAMNLLQFAKMFLDCNKSDKFIEYLKKAQEYLNCSCGCGDDSSVRPFITIGGTESIAIVE